MMMAGFLTVTGVNAAENENKITVSPLVFELSANPGDSLVNEIRVDNTSDKAIDLAVAVRNFVALGEEGQASLTDEDTTFSLAKWVTADPAEFTVQPKSYQMVKFTIKTPPNAEPGGHFGSVVIKTKPSTEPGKVVIAQEISPLVLLRVAGDATESASIESFKVTPNFSENGPIKFELRIRNSGSVHVKPKSTVSVKDMFGSEVAKVQFEARNVLPDSVRKFETQWKPTWLLGQYTATVTSVYGSENQVIQSQTSFWGFPTTLAMFVGIPLLLVIILLIAGRKRVKRSLGVLFGKEQSKAAPSHHAAPVEPSDNDTSESHHVTKHRNRNDQ